MTVWRLRLDGLYAQRVCGGLPEKVDGLEFSYLEWGRDEAVYLPPAIAQVVGWWHRNGVRWCLHRLACRLGVWSVRPGEYLSAGWWTWPWRGNRSWWAIRFANKHGYAAYKARYGA